VLRYMQHCTALRGSLCNLWYLERPPFRGQGCGTTGGRPGSSLAVAVAGPAAGVGAGAAAGRTVSSSAAKQQLEQPQVDLRLGPARLPPPGSPPLCLPPTTHPPTHSHTHMCRYVFLAATSTWKSESDLQK
jgi:hypothetical protein